MYEILPGSTFEGTDTTCKVLMVFKLFFLLVNLETIRLLDLRLKAGLLIQSVWTVLFCSLHVSMETPYSAQTSMERERARTRVYAL